MAMKELSEMRNKVNNLETENLYMKSTIQHNPVLNEIYSGIGNIQTKNNTSSFINSKSVKNAGVCLFLLIFSFGLFFNVQNSISQSQPKVYMPQNIPTALPQNLPIATISSNNLRPLGNNARKLLSKTKTQISSLQSNQPPQTLPVIEEQIIPVFVKSVTDISTNETIIEQQNQQISIQPNVHLYCMNTREYIINPTKDPNELIISLMIPRNSISSNSPILNHINSNDDLVEVTCKVLTHPTKI